MKYLTKYKLFESTDSIREIEETLNDILLEIQDEGYITKLEVSYDISSIFLGHISIRHENQRILTISEITDTLKRIMNYLDSNGYDCDVITGMENKSYYTKDDIELSIGVHTKTLNIKIYKKNSFESKPFEHIDKVSEICKKFDIKNYKINPNGSIDVMDHHLDLKPIGHKLNRGKYTEFVRFPKLKELPLTFNKVDRFLCCDNELTTMIGGPVFTIGDFNCDDNKLTTFEGFPKYVGGYLGIKDNNIMTFEGAPDEVSGTFHFGGNPIQHIYDLINGEKPTKYDLIKGTEEHLFTYKSREIKLLNRFNCIKIVNGKGVIELDKFNHYLKTIDRNPVEKVEGYTCI